MRTTPRFFGLGLGSGFGFGLFASCLLSMPAILAQTNPPPFDPREMVTREPRTLTKPAERSAAVDVLDRVRQDFNVHDISTAYELKVSFETKGASQYEGEWTMDEVSDGGSHWRWTAQLRDLHVIRIGSDGRVYGTDPSEPVPMRVQMVRSALLRPIGRNAGSFAMRAADVERDGKSMSCLLLSGAIPPNPAPRSW